MKPLSFSVLLIILLTLFIPFNLAYPADPPAGQVVSKGPVTVEVIKAKIKEAERLQDNFQRAKQTIGVTGTSQVLGRMFTEKDNGFIQR